MLPGKEVVRVTPNRQMGCMTGIIQLFDPHQILSNSRFNSTKRLLPSSSPSDKPEISPDLPPAKNPGPKSRQIHRRSVSVVARLMGLEDLPVEEPENRPELRRSVSEKSDSYDPAEEGDAKAELLRQSGGLFQRRSFDAQEFFPEKIEKRLRTRGVEEPGRDLETLKQILEALQLKGLLHSKPSPEQRVDLFSGRRSAPVQAPIVVMKPAQRVSKGRVEMDRDFGIVVGRPIRGKPSEPPHRRRRQDEETQGGHFSQRRIPAAGRPPKLSPKKPGSGQTGPPKNRRPTAHMLPKEVYSTVEELPSTSISEFDDCDLESERKEDYMSGRRLLERCDKLLHSIAAFTSSAEQVIPIERQLSPVSVLDSSFLSDESLTSSLPIRPLPFNDQLVDWHEDHWKHQPTFTANDPAVSPEKKTPSNKHQNEEYAFVVDVLHDRHCSGDEAFASIENRHRTAGSSALHRRLIFDTVTELADRKREFSPWDSFSGASAATGTSLIRAVWDELCQIQERVPATDVMEATCSVIRKDMVATSERERGWGVSGEDMSEVVLHIERQLFKDLVADTIRELADLIGRCRRTVTLSRRKLVF